VHDCLFFDRNKAWLPRIEGYLNTRETEFVIVGLGHLIGKRRHPEIPAKQGLCHRATRKALIVQVQRQSVVMKGYSVYKSLVTRR
jgi:hypothetical protein